MTTKEIRQAYEEGRNDDALRLILSAFDTIDSAAGDQGPYFITMFQWQVMMDAGYAPAREAMVRVRDEQIARLLAGQFTFGAYAESWRHSRFHIVLEMNEKLNDSRSSYDAFIALLDLAPEVARQHAYRVVPAMVDIGDYTLEERYHGDPLAELSMLNQYAREFPLYPQRDQPPRMWAELYNFARSVTLMMAVHRGLGRESEAVALHDTALGGIESLELRALAQREIAEPGVMHREIVEYRANQA